MSQPLGDRLLALALTALVCGVLILAALRILAIRPPPGRDALVNGVAPPSGASAGTAADGENGAASAPGRGARFGLPPAPPPPPPELERWLYPVPPPARSERPRPLAPRHPGAPSSAISGAPGLPLQTVPAGTPVRSRPADSAPVLGVVAATSRLGVLERRADGWSHLRELGPEPRLEGWVELPLQGDRDPRSAHGADGADGADGVAGAAPPFGRATVPPRPLPAQAASAAQLERARQSFGEDGAAAVELGDYAALTDLADGPLLATLARLAAEVERTYPQRYGVTPAGPPAETVLLYARRVAYEALKAEEPRIAHLPAAGHTSRGLAAVDLEGRSAAEAGAVLVHELVHLLNRRALGPALPPWLDEGIAEDLSLSWIAADGTLDPVRLGGTAERDGDTLRLGGGWAAVSRLDDALAGAPLDELARLLAMDWQQFVEPAGREDRYAESALFVRFLLDSGDPRLVDGFRTYLRGIAAGESADPEVLRDALGLPWRALAVRFRVWVGETRRGVLEELGAGAEEPGARSTRRR